MSGYCGTCGGFQHDDCPHRSDGRCTPAVNPFEMEAIKARAMVAAAEAATAAVVASIQGRHVEASALLAIAEGLGLILEAKF